MANMKKNLNYVIWIQTVSMSTYKTDHIFKDTAKGVEARIDTSNYELDIPLRNQKNKNVIRLMKDDLVEKTMKSSMR